MSVQDLKKLYERVTTWQRKTFPNQTAASILKHMRLELKEIEAAPHDIEERADMAILAMGYADRTGEALAHLHPSLYPWGVGTSQQCVDMLSGRIEMLPTWTVDLIGFIAACSMGSGLSTEQFLDAIAAKMDKNEARRWPAPSEQVPGQPVEHLREPLGVSESCDGVRGTLTILAPSSNQLVSLVDPVSGVALHLSDVVTVRDLIAERTEWRANNDRLREERLRVREILGARPNEGVIEAARRVMVRPVDTNPGAALAPGEEAPQ